MASRPAGASSPARYRIAGGPKPAPRAVANEPTVTIDVKDEEVRAILSSMQKQCAVKNLVIDPDVQARGTFFFRNLPCSTAFRTVMTSLGLRAEIASNSLIAVGKPPR